MGKHTTGGGRRVVSARAAAYPIDRNDLGQLSQRLSGTRQSFNLVPKPADMPNSTTVLNNQFSAQLDNAQSRNPEIRANAKAWIRGFKMGYERPYQARKLRGEGKLTPDVGAGVGMGLNILMRELTR